MNDNNSLRPWGMDAKAFCLLMHLSQLSNFIIPGLGVALPIVMWATNKEDSAEIDAHGKNIMNWMLSALIYGVICAILTVVYVGTLGLFALGFCNLAFVIIGAVKANNGQIWKYPLSIRFFKE